MIVFLLGLVMMNCGGVVLEEMCDWQREMFVMTLKCILINTVLQLICVLISIIEI